jgi:hypothetical protein
VIWLSVYYRGKFHLSVSHSIYNSFCVMRLLLRAQCMLLAILLQQHPLANRQAVSLQGMPVRVPQRNQQCAQLSLHVASVLQVALSARRRGMLMSHWHLLIPTSKNTHRAHISSHVRVRGEFAWNGWEIQRKLLRPRAGMSRRYLLMLWTLSEHSRCMKCRNPLTSWATISFLRILYSYWAS